MARTSRRAAAVYLVERTAYEASDYGETPRYYASGGEEGESHVPVRAFADKAAAEACRADLEAEARRDLCPALFAYDLPKNLAAKLKKIGLTPLEFTGAQYEHADQFRKWWGEQAADMAPQQRAAVWRLFPKVAFYRVTEATLEG
jgi:hypothetical protein